MVAMVRTVPVYTCKMQLQQLQAFPKWERLHAAQALNQGPMGA